MADEADRRLSTAKPELPRGDPTFFSLGAPDGAAHRDRAAVATLATQSRQRPYVRSKLGLAATSERPMAGSPQPAANSQRPAVGPLRTRVRTEGPLPSQGAPPIWPRKETLQHESAFRELLDKYPRPSGREGPSLLLTRGVDRAHAEALGRLSGLQPFLFGHLVAASSGVVREMARPSDHRVVMRKDEAMDGKRFGHPCSVFFDEGRFVMYYHSGEGAGARAESTDGLQWTNRSHLDFVSSHGTDYCVLLDRYEGDPRFRWKMTNNCGPPWQDSVCFLSSPDGLHWTRHGNNTPIYGKFTDTLSCLYHDKPGEEYQLLLRAEPGIIHINPLRGSRGVKVVSGQLDEVLSSVNIEVEWDAEVLNTFLLDKEGGEPEMFRRQLYSLSRTYLPGAGYLGIAQVLEFPSYAALNKTAQVEEARQAELLRMTELYDSVQLYLMPSRDGIHFDTSWIYAGVPLLPRENTSGFHFFAHSGHVPTLGGQHWVYYDRSRARHESRWRSGEPPEIALARFQEGRVVRLRPLGGRGVVVTPAFEFDPRQTLHLDVGGDAARESRVTAELVRAAEGGPGLLDAPSAVSSEALEGASGSVGVRWLADPSGLAGEQVHLRLTLVNASLYSFRLSP